jgi:hypothetical protein
MKLILNKITNAIPSQFYDEFKLKINYDCDAYDADGNLIFIFRKNVINPEHNIHLDYNHCL